MSVSGIGEELRLERLRQGLTVDEIVQRTRISARSLAAIEADAFDQLPGVVFARNFVRLYALELHLDADALVARLPRVDIDSAPMPVPPASTGRASWDPRITAAFASVVWLTIAAAAGTGAWYYYNHYGRHLVSTVSAAPPPATAAQEATQLAADATPAESTHPVEVVLTAREATWVQVTVDGQTAFAALLHPNDKRAIAADAQVKVVTGNAGGLDISLNGKALDALGPRGQVRTVRLTAEGPQLVPQNPPASAPL